MPSTPHPNATHPNATLSTLPLTPPATALPRTEADWRAHLAARGAEPLAYEVTRRAATERPFSGRYQDHWQPGCYHCIGCGAALFEATTKFDAGCGWPSFAQPASGSAIAERRDASHGMSRVETLCASCGAHLGHVFPDGPPPGQPLPSGGHGSGLRYCINSAALDFQPCPP